MMTSRRTHDVNPASIPILILRMKCKGTYACVRPHRYTYGNYRNMVANVDASDIMCRFI